MTRYLTATTIKLAIFVDDITAEDAARLSLLDHNELLQQHYDNEISITYVCLDCISNYDVDEPGDHLAEINWQDYNELQCWYCDRD